MACAIQPTVRPKANKSTGACTGNPYARVTAARPKSKLGRSWSNSDPARQTPRARCHSG